MFYSTYIDAHIRGDAMGFTHLHCHSAYSLLEGTATPQTLTGLAGRLKMPALALTDRNNLFGVIPFYTHARKAGVKPVIGMEVDLDDGSSLVLLARNMDGYRNLCHLATTLCRGTDPETFQPAGFDDDEEWLVASGEWLVSADDPSPLTPNPSPLPLPWEP